MSCRSVTMKAIRFFVLAIALCMLQACASGGSGGGTVTIPPSPICQTPECANSQLCKTTQNPTAIFGLTEIGLSALAVEKPSAKKDIAKAYGSLTTAFSAPDLTYADLSVVASGELSKLTGKYGPVVVSAVGVITENFPATATKIDECDRKILLNHCRKVVTAMGGKP